MNQTTKKELLVRMRELIADPAHHTRGVGARNSSGEAVLAISKDAVCFCLLGAASRAYSEACKIKREKGEGRMSVDFWGLSSEITKFLPCGYVNMANFNDAVSHAQVIQFLDRVIAAQPD